MQIDASISPAFSAGAGATQEQRETTLSSDFETFLQMLVTQAENQDPLNPIESSDYAAQLATFAAVEQQVLTNDLLQQMQSQLSGSAMSELSGWVGADVLVQAPVMFTGTPVQLAPQTATGATSAQLIVKNSAGAIVSREALSVPPDEIVWAGTDENGTPLPSGVYTFEVESAQDGRVIATTTAHAYGEVAEVTADADGVSLTLQSGASVAMNEVSAVRLAEG
ncbi:Basal-body rod modification protein FlgD [Roseivivax sp. THAF40]|uniref:flagellar hook capping FlgD N-terminal domain-containing protein n=1 Tax=unclassified Roseivivax TaxID=2639302 RepID=UPI001268A9FC|nr:MULTISPECIES: flagellar hook capping FlgD N-terminal domain-containing protein [unclassified Roseivivax]QFS84786.1 Basal-body rod modification protein FlgD [Roseivivax sp. THAF197b]QFT48613.1 Basal-body rod modification protein FlgD [Roseivivax sp. THAF40]